MKGFLKVTSICLHSEESFLGTEKVHNGKMSKISELVILLCILFLSYLPVFNLESHLLDFLFKKNKLKTMTKQNAQLKECCIRW